MNSNILINVANGNLDGLPPYDDYVIVPFGASMQASLNVPFTSISGTVVDPDVVTFTFTPPGVGLTAPPTPLVYTYTHGSTPPDPSFVINRTAAGAYSATIDNSSYPMGVWKVVIAGAPGSSGADTTKTKISFERHFLVA